MRVEGRKARGNEGRDHEPTPPRERSKPIFGALAVVAFLGLGQGALAQYPEARVKDLNERSGLLMRSAPMPARRLPPDPYRDNFYATRFADRGLVKHPNYVCTQGLYGLGWKSACTESVYPFFYGSPGTGKVDSSCLPWHRSLLALQGIVHPFRPIGMYYSMGSYVPIYDLDPLAPGPGPYPYPFYFNWWKGG